jgi:MoaA/NifB/PqqE/SkfB family radical SAM enzyme
MNVWHSLEVFLANFRITGSINRRKPKLFRRILRGYLRSRIGNVIALRFMDIALSYTCNFSCQHCSADALSKPGVKNLSFEEYGRVADEASRAGVLVFHFTGGEPLMQKGLLDYIRVFRPDEHLISIQTNGWHVDGQFIDDYKEAGGDILCVSVDSAQADIHDKFRQKRGSWERAIAAVKLARAKGLQVLMSYTITHFNLGSEDFENMIALSRGLGANLSLNLAVPAGKWKGNLDYLLNRDDRAVLNRYLKKYPHVRTDFESNWKVRGCPAFKEKCYLTPYGEVLPCPFIHVSFGNVRSKTLSEIRQSALKTKYLSVYHPICIAAEDTYFIHNAGCYNVDLSRLPIRHTDSRIFAAAGEKQ